MKTIEQIKEFLQNELSDSELFAIYNNYCDETGYGCIYDMDELDDIMSDSTPSDIAMRIFYGDFRPNDNYFMFDGYANLKSFDYMEDEIDFDDLARYIYDNEDCLNNYELGEFLDLDNENEAEA